VGRAVDDVEVEIVDDRGGPLPPGHVGLVRVRGHALPAGYIDDPAATAAAFRDGWYHPGDLGVLSADGALLLVGRADDVINCDGTKIYPAEIEAALLEHGAVAEAAAFPLAVGGYRQIPAAAVILREPATAAALLAFCGERLGPRAPRIIHTVRGLPKTATGKVLKREPSATPDGAAGGLRPDALTERAGGHEPRRAAGNRWRSKGSRSSRAAVAHDTHLMRRCRFSGQSSSVPVTSIRYTRTSMATTPSATRLVARNIPDERGATAPMMPASSSASLAAFSARVR